MSRYDDDRPTRRGRDDDDRGSRRSRDDDDRGYHSRSRDDDRPSRGRDDDDRPSRGRDDDDRGSRRTASSSAARSYSYEGRSADQARKRSEQGGNDFDKILIDGVKMWKPNDGNNTIRILPPTWPKPEHYGYDIYVHYAVGPDRQSYLCAHKMKGEPCPICEERAEAQRAGDEKYAKELEPKKRVLTYVIDRDHSKEGVQAWAMPWTVDRDIVKVSTDRRSGEVLPVDHPEEGFDILFEKKGAKDRTEYLGVAVDHRDSPLGKPEYLDYAVDHPLPDQLQFFDYDHIAKVFGGSGGGRPASRRDDDDDRGGRGRDRDDDRGSSRGRGRDDDDPPRRSSSRVAEYTWDEVHAMTSGELDALAEREGVNPAKFSSDDDLADELCSVLKIERAPRRHSPGRDDDDPPRRSRGDDDAPPRRGGGDDDDRLAGMRRRREADDEPPRRQRGD